MRWKGWAGMVRQKALAATWAAARRIGVPATMTLCFWLGLAAVAGVMACCLGLFLFIMTLGHAPLETTFGWPARFASLKTVVENSPFAPALTSFEGKSIGQKIRWFLEDFGGVMCMTCFLVLSSACASGLSLLPKALGRLENLANEAAGRHKAQWEAAQIEAAAHDGRARANKKRFGWRFAGKGGARADDAGASLPGEIPGAREGFPTAAAAAAKAAASPARESAKRARRL